MSWIGCAPAEASARFQLSGESATRFSCHRRTVCRIMQHVVGFPVTFSKIRVIHRVLTRRIQSLAVSSRFIRMIICVILHSLESGPVPWQSVNKSPCNPILNRTCIAKLRKIISARSLKREKYWGTIGVHVLTWKLHGGVLRWRIPWQSSQDLAGLPRRVPSSRRIYHRGRFCRQKLHLQVFRGLKFGRQSWRLSAR